MTDTKDELRAHNYITTYSGERFYYDNPGPFKLRDIAHALSYLPRFSGMTRHFYSVAQHSLMVADMARDCAFFDVRDEQYALLHDAHEAYTGDIPTPLKWACPELKAIEDRIAFALRFKFRIHWMTSVLVKECDTAALHVEAAALLRPMPAWVVPPLDQSFPIEDLPPEVVERRFLDRAKSLGLV